MFHHSFIPWPTVKGIWSSDQSVDDGDVDHEDNYFDDNHAYEVSPRGLEEW